MYSRWTQHLQTEDEKNLFKHEVLRARPVLNRLLQILDEDEALLDRSEMDQRIYDTPNWDYRQAHKNGNRQQMQAVRLLIDLDQQKGTKNESTR
jgi:hypothetical protein